MGTTHQVTLVGDPKVLPVPVPNTCKRGCSVVPQAGSIHLGVDN